MQPDAAFVSRDRLTIVDEANCKGAPDLVVEVLSESTRRRDLVDKRLLYQSSGVREYWVVDPYAESVQVFRRDDSGAYERKGEWTVEAHGLFESPVVSGFALVLRELFAR